MITMIKTTIKLLLRNKGFLFFLLVTPIISTVILAQKVDNDIYKPKNDVIIAELKSVDDKAIYLAETGSFAVKVYDSSGSRLSEYVLSKLAADGMFSVCRCDTSGMTCDEIRRQAEKDAYDDRAGVIMYINDSFDSAVMNDELEKGMELFRVSDDKRRELFDAELKDLLTEIYRAGAACGGDTEMTVDMLVELSSQLPEKKVVDLSGKDGLQLDAKQTNSSVQIGYAFAIITLGFMFCGVFAAHIVITEDNNKVFTRIKMSGTSTLMYFLSKFAVVFLICLLQTAVLAACLCFVNGLDLGMPLPVFLAVIFLLGLILGTFSMLTGVLFGDIMSSNYAAFAVWSISAMLSGLLFPIDDTSAVLKTVSYLMPQRWFSDVAKRLIAGASGTYSMLLCVTAAYLILIISIGSVGLKLREQES